MCEAFKANIDRCEDARREVVTAKTIFWDVTPYSVVEIYGRKGEGEFCLHLKTIRRYARHRLYTSTRLHGVTEQADSYNTIQRLVFTRRSVRISTGALTWVSSIPADKHATSVFFQILSNSP
jgi:hypothetical protein